MQRIFFDESGNTGQDLLNPNQRVFILASNNFSDDELKTLADLFFTPNEIHFYKLSNSAKGRKAIISFLNHDLITEKNIVYSISHKKYATVGQMVDQLIEPVFHANNVDIYLNESNIHLTNVLFYYGNFKWDKQTFDSLLHSFVKMIRTQNQTEIISFYAILNNLINSVASDEKLFLHPLIQSQLHISSILENLNKFSIDLTVSSFYVLCDIWHKTTNDKLRILHDFSKQIEHYRSYIEFTKNLEISKQEIGFGNNTLTFPTQIESLELVSSNNNLGVQISDLIASSIAFMHNNSNQKHRFFVQEIKNSKLLELSNFHAIWPNTTNSVQATNMSDTPGTNILDFLANEMTKLDFDPSRPNKQGK